MIDRLRDIFKSDDFIPTTSVFPDIDADKIARDLKLKNKAIERGKKNLPVTTDATLDANEMEAVTRIEEARRKGLDNYEQNRRVYSKRFELAQTARAEIETISRQAEANFDSEVKTRRTQLSSKVEDLTEWNNSLQEYRAEHGIFRPAYEDPGWAKIATLMLAFLIVETILNGILFAGKNELGLVGGIFIALLISIVNVGVSGLGGFLSKNLRHKFFIRKIAGMTAFGGWLALSFGINLAVAHFRDAIETLESWSAATQASMATLFETPLDLVSMESWLLLAWGMLIAILTFMKFNMSGEPYPGYATIYEYRQGALYAVEDEITDAIISLQEKRDESIKALQDANDLVRDQISDAADALYGRHMMRSHLDAFLGQCDMKATTLLKRYRDENRGARTTEAPAYFDETFAFPKFSDHEDPVQGGTDRREKAAQKIEEVTAIVDAAIATIYDKFTAALDEYSDTETLISVDLKDKASMRRAKEELERVAAENKNITSSSVTPIRGAV